MRSLLVGVIGHVDHGKTALVKALTGIDADRLKEERARGISIVLGFSCLHASAGEIDLVDMPGHERFVRTMISGATGMDAVLLVIAATEGIRRQTVEHLQIARLLGLRRGVVAVSKCDLAAAATAERVAAETADLATRMGFEPMPAALCSARTGQGVAALASALGELLQAAPESRAPGFPYLPIDRVFAVPGFGTVVTGTLRRGSLKTGDEVEIVPGGGEAQIRGLQIHSRSVDAAALGRRVAINLRGVEQGVLHPGQALARPGLIGLSVWLDVEIVLLDDAPRPLANGAPLRLLFGTAEAGVRLRLLDREILDPGSRALAQLRCPEGVTIPARERFILRLASPPTTIGGGCVIDPLAARRRRFEPPIIARLQALAAATPPEAMALLLRECGLEGVPLVDLARHVGATPEDICRWSREAGAAIFRTGTVLDRSAVEVVERGLVTALERFHHGHPTRAGATREQLRRLSEAATAPPIFNEIIAGLVRRGTLAFGDGLVRLARFVPPASSDDAVRALERSLAARFRAGGLMPPDWEPLAGADRQRHAALKRLLRAGILVQTVDRVQKRVVIFHRDEVQRAAALLRGALAARPEGLLAREAGAALGISRKFSIPLLEYFDRVGLTRRQGDRRHLMKSR